MFWADYRVLRYRKVLRAITRLDIRAVVGYSKGCCVWATARAGVCGLQQGLGCVGYNKG